MVLSETPLLGNRVDRFIWDGVALTLNDNVIRLRAIQQDAGQPERGNHNGGVLRIGPDGKLYVFVGDLGRRGNLQNLRCGPEDAYNCPPDAPSPDDQFGGPEPDNEHRSGLVLRLNLDGTAPPDNPFFAAGTSMGGEVGANIQKLYSYGHRNSFGMAFDPKGGSLWLQENGDDSFSELNRVTPGMNGGWVQISGPVARIAQFKQIETTFGGMNLQQIRWSPTNIADSPSEALSRLFSTTERSTKSAAVAGSFSTTMTGERSGGQLSGSRLRRQDVPELWRRVPVRRVVLLVRRGPPRRERPHRPPGPVHRLPVSRLPRELSGGPVAHRTYTDRGAQRMTTTRFLGAGLLFVLALSVTGCGARSINDLIADPAKYRNRSVTVRGTVEQSASVAGRGAYQIADRGQSLWVVTTSGAPRQGARVKVTGRVQDGYDLGVFGNVIKLPGSLKSGLVLLESSHKASN